MLIIFNIVLPVFLLVGAGYLALRGRVFPEVGIDPLLNFVTRIATPCLLFEAMYRLNVSAAFEWRMLVSFYAGAFLCFAIGAGAARAVGRRPGEAISVGFASYFSNTLLIGLPIMLRAYGEAATEPMFGIIAFHAPLLYAVGIIAMEAVRRDGTGAVAAAKRAAGSILQNALMIGIALGLAFNITGVRLPEAVEGAVELLASAALPTALFALGAALTRYRLQAELGLALVVTALMLIVHPLVAWLLADLVFGLETPFVRAAIVTAAMPAGLNVYVFASMYHRAEGVAASAVLLSTGLSILTISAWLVFLGGAGLATP